MKNSLNIFIMCYKYIVLSAVTTFMLNLSPCSCDNSNNSSYNNAIKNFPNSINSNKVNSDTFHGQLSENTHFNFLSTSSASLSSSESSTVPSSSADGTQNGSQQIPLVRLPSNTLLKYSAYKDVSILHFRIPTDTRSAVFSFKAYEESKSAFRNCQPQDITLHLKAGSYPVISPENITFPKHFLSADQRFEIHNLQFKSDGITQRMVISEPHPGNWFAVAFISWTDPNNERIEQQGLAASCETLLLSEMSVSRIQPKIVNSNEEYKDALFMNNTDKTTYKFFVPRNVDICLWKITITKTCSSCPAVFLSINSHSIPNFKNFLKEAIFYPHETEGRLEFYPHENAWHYFELMFASNESSAAHKVTTTTTSAPQLSTTTTTLKSDYIEFTISITFQNFENIDEDIYKTERYDSKQYSPFPYGTRSRIFDNYPLLRQTYREFFMFDYDLLPDINGTVPTSINMTSGITTLMKFDVGDVYDIGGTLSFAIALRYDIHGNMIDSTPSMTSGDAIAEKLVADNLPISNQTVIVCMRLNEPGIPTWPDKCVYGRHAYPANSVINNTDADTGTGLIHVPFPESGQWYVTLGLFCKNTETTARTTIIDSVKNFIKKHNNELLEMKPPCSCATEMNLTFYLVCLKHDKCLTTLNETTTLKIKECMMDSKCTPNHDRLSLAFERHHKYSTEQSVNVGGVDTSCNTSIMFTIASNPCVSGRCGRYGKCYHYMSGGFVFSTCLCSKNYRGWDCTEDSQVPSSISVLFASLLLTLSNLLFIPSIYFAIRREYYTEAVIYFFAMFFSTFYHACDSGEEEFSFCLAKISVLQFCDFYCGLLAIWVTLIAMANIRPTFMSLLHMFGAILLAFGTELNKQSLWVFLAPALTGICIISVSWGLKCRKTKKLFPSRKYLALYLPLGSVFVMVGLVCYAFLQTKQNYHIVHSIWHMVMALSILCLLPNRKAFAVKRC